MTSSRKSFRVLDSHTGGEPTRTIVAGGPRLDDLSAGYEDASAFLTHSGAIPSKRILSSATVEERLRIVQRDHDGFRRAIVNEPRGSDVMVGALLVPPHRPENLAGVIFFNNVGYLGMCGHGTIGVVETLRYLGWMQPGVQTLETCVGEVQVELHPDHRVTVANVSSYRHHAKLAVQVDGLEPLYADIAYGGNWFCLIECPQPTWLDRTPGELVALSQRILAVVRQTYPEVDHVELFAPPRDPRNDSRSFVLCPGGAYDRSPCGTGTSAKLACLAADGKLQPGVTWRQESIIGSVFEARYAWHDATAKTILPSITSRAFVNADVTVLIDQDDPFAWGIV